MYTFLILIVSISLIYGIICGKKIWEKQIQLFFIVILGTLIGTVIINGILGFRAPYITVIQKERSLSLNKSDINDNIFYSYLRYKYVLNKKGNVTYNYIDPGKLNSVIINNESEKISIKFLDKGDSIPKIIILQDERKIDKRWASSLGLPHKNRRFIAYIPYDKNHIFLIKELNEKFYKISPKVPNDSIINIANKMIKSLKFPYEKSI